MPVKVLDLPLSTTPHSTSTNDCSDNVRKQRVYELMSILKLIIIPTPTSRKKIPPRNSHACFLNTCRFSLETDFSRTSAKRVKIQQKKILIKAFDIDHLNRMPSLWHFKLNPNSGSKSQEKNSQLFYQDLYTSRPLEPERGEQRHGNELT